MATETIKPGPNTSVNKISHYLDSAIGKFSSSILNKIMLSNIIYMYIYIYVYISKIYQGISTLVNCIYAPESN